MAAIDVRELTKYYGETRGVEDLTFAVEEGEVFGFLGPNGAGKTTTIRTLLGFQSPTSGGATILGYDVADETDSVAMRERVGYLPSDAGLDETVTGRRLLDYYAALRGDERSADLLELFDPPLDREVEEYSRGNRQKLAIVLAFMHDPDVLIMDEPTSGLDPLMQERFYEFVRSERARGKTVFFSSHVLSEVRKVCDRVGIVREGHLVELEAVDALLSRSGKMVRVHVEGEHDPDEFEVPGAHDVTLGGDEGARVTVPDGGESRPERSESRDGRGSDDQTDGGRPTTTATFTYTGEYEPLLEHLLTFDLLDLTIEEAPLEDVFMRFYGDGEVRR